MLTGGGHRVALWDLRTHEEANACLRMSGLRAEGRFRVCSTTSCWQGYELEAVSKSGGGIWREGGKICTSIDGTTRLQDSCILFLLKGKTAQVIRIEEQRRMGQKHEQDACVGILSGGQAEDAES
jgi:hypothetical protein